MNIRVHNFTWSTDVCWC